MAPMTLLLLFTQALNLSQSVVPILKHDVQARDAQTRDAQALDAQARGEQDRDAQVRDAQVRGRHAQLW